MDDDQIAKFIHRWGKSEGAERANYVSFLKELCDVLGVDHPEPTVGEEDANAYVFEKNVVFDNGDGTHSTRRIDLYRRGAFICETKQGVEKHDAEELLSERAIAARKKRKGGHGERGTKAYDDTMLRARGQAEQYARNLPVSEGRPPFLMVIDVGHSIELYAEFSQTGGVYTAFPDPSTHRIKLADLTKADIREQLRLVWEDSASLDPARRTAKVTRKIAAKLAQLAKSLEIAGHDPEDVAQFLMRCLFTMFAEDIQLLGEEKDQFLNVLRAIKDPAHFVPEMEALWRTMNTGGYSTQLKKHLLQFNGGLFAESHAIPLNRDQLDLLIDAAKQSWSDVEPAIFGTLLERALDPAERHKLGAHYTPRSYVERLVIPTVVEPLREEWDAARAAAVTLAKEGDVKGATAELEKFHDRLCDVKVLDPACGSGNFLYVVLEHLKRLEGEVFAVYESIAHRQMTFETNHTVDPHQLLGIEINPRAAAIAELVLWIGYLQWHFRTRGKATPPEPVIKDFKNIERRDAVLSWSERQIVLDVNGEPTTRWDGKTTKPHPVTKKEVPDESARLPVYVYLNPQASKWPTADFIVGNPPYIGNKKMRADLGTGYVDALYKAYDDIPNSVDFVMYWWHKAAEGVTAKSAQHFGFITTNSIHQYYNRRLTKQWISPESLELNFAVPDHPWVDTQFCAAVRIAMTVGRKARGTNSKHGALSTLISEIAKVDDGEATLVFQEKVGYITPSLRVGVDPRSVGALNANDGLCWQGCKLVGEGFQIDRSTSIDFQAKDQRAHKYLRNYWAGKDITQTRKDRDVIDFFGLTEEEARSASSILMQHIIDNVLPFRAQNSDAGFRTKWWLFGRPRPAMREALNAVKSYFAISEVSEHCIFRRLEWPRDLVDGGIVAIASDDPLLFAILHSRIHVEWAVAAGGRMGKGNTPRYQNTFCFDPFPFPLVNKEQAIRIRRLGEQLDEHRKRQQKLHPTLTMTSMYNVLEKLRSGEALTAKEKKCHEQGLVSVLLQIHDDLDAAVAEGYGWPVDLSDEEILERLVALNHERAEEENRGIIRWLRPEFQNPQGKTQRSVVEDDDAEGGKTESGKGKVEKRGKAKKLVWPKSLAEQAAAVQGALVALGGPASDAEVAGKFQRSEKNMELISNLLETLGSLGRARELADGRWVAT
ncbi:MAG: DNA methyltransferase [Pirellulales bacterium]